MSEKTQQQDAGTTGVFMRGAILGGIVGAVMAIWYAPRSGREMRRLLQGRRRELVTEVEQTAAQMRRQIEGESVVESIEAGKVEARKLNKKA
jgi:gas vesicle protein